MKTLSELYNDLHQIPELGFQEFETQEYILSQLKNLNCLVYELEPTGIIVFFDYQQEKTICFRSEMDGLPILEQINLPYKSKNQGNMHACGHDGHMSILLKLCEYLSQNTACVNVLCLFQPSEEIYGGSLKVLHDSYFQSFKIEAIYALHLWPNIPCHKIYSRPSAFFSSATEIDVEVYGKSVHMAHRESGKDAIAIATEFNRSIFEEECGVLYNCGKISSNGIRNTVCSYVKMEASLRSFSIKEKIVFLDLLHKKAQKISKENGAKIYINSKKSIPILKNDETLYKRYSYLIDDVAPPMYESEDFAEYCSSIPAFYVLLGIGDSDALHTSTFSINEEVLTTGLDYFIKIIQSYSSV